MTGGNGECPSCGSPNGFPCSDCGFRMPPDWTPFNTRKSVPTESDLEWAHAMDDLEHDRRASAERRERYS